MNRRVRYITRLWAALVLPIGFISCLSGHDSVVADTDPAGWSRPLTLSYSNTDTVSVREAALLLRYGNDARGGDFTVEARSPSGVSARDTIHAAILPERRRNNIRESRLPFRTGIVLTEAGDYLFTVIPPEGTCGVWSAGIDFQQ